jgi:hypothetical protein
MKGHFMGTDVKADLHIPDLWYDFYARILPGSLFVFGLRYYYLSINTLPDLDEVVVLTIVGFVCGLFSQPVASRLTKAVYKIVEKRSGIKDEDFIRNGVNPSDWTRNRKRLAR